MRFQTKIAVVLRDDLPVWQKLNVACFLSGGIVGANPETIGEPYRDASGVAYGPMIRQPAMVYAAGAADLQKVLQRALSRGIAPTVFTLDLFATMNDADNRAAVAAVATQDLDLAGLGLYAESKIVDKVIKGLKLHG
ncbi:DUF2000 family protein [Microbaculum marinum]|uniref:DUF2000 family protein n=1 Tax=Microbaculum marinum TaxID=1764581 RepID=A0AAW9S4B6_9HYPH